MGYSDFYEQEYEKDKYANVIEMKKHPFYQILNQYIEKYEVRNKEFKAVEIGSGRGALQDIIEDYTGLDYANTVVAYYHKPFVCASASHLPFEDNQYDFLWSYCVLEHVPKLEDALNEMVRIVKNGGHLILRPAWHCHRWLANGYQVRPYSDFNIIAKLYKFLIPFFNWQPVRAIAIMSKRCVEFVSFLMRRKPVKIKYRKLNANYDIFWQGDSDACNHLDPFSVIVWFEERGHKCVSHPTRKSQFFIKSGEIDILIQKVK